MARETAEQAIIARERAALERCYQGDPFGFVELLADDVTYFDDIAAGTRLDGGASVREYLAAFKGKLSPKVQLHGDIGVLTLNLNTYSPDGNVTSRWKATEVYRRIAGDWRF